MTIPNSVTSIGSKAFLLCTDLPSLTIPASVSSIGVGPFTDCTNLKEIIVEDGNKFYCSDNGALYNYNKTELIQCPGACTEFNIPTSVASIGARAFQGCISLISVTIPNSVTTIGDDAFLSCYSLASVTIPSSVTSIGDDAFSWCTSLSSVTLTKSHNTKAEKEING